MKFEKEIDQVKNSEAYFLFSYVEQKLVVSERFHFHFFLAFRKILCPSPNYPTALFGMFISSFYSCFKENKAVDNWHVKGGPCSKSGKWWKLIHS